VDDDNLSMILSELSSSDFSVKEHHSSIEEESQPALSDADVNQYFLKQTKAIIDASVGAVKDITPYIVQAQDAKEIEALSKLVTAAAQALDTLNKKDLINKKADRDEQLERIKIQSKKELVELQQKSSKNLINNNIVIASREDIMKKLFNTELNAEVYEIQDK
jgi:hypothetical protein